MKMVEANTEGGGLSSHIAHETEETVDVGNLS